VEMGSGLQGGRSGVGYRVNEYVSIPGRSEEGRLDVIAEMLMKQLLAEHLGVHCFVWIRSRQAR
jgi:hypothetical protein